MFATSFLQLLFSLLHSLTKVNFGLNLSKSIVISQSSSYLISAIYNSTHYFVLHEKLCLLASAYLHSVFLLYHYVFVSFARSLSISWPQKVEVQRNSISALCFPMWTRFLSFISTRVSCLVSSLIYLQLLKVCILLQTVLWFSDSCPIAYTTSSLACLKKIQI